MATKNRIFISFAKEDSNYRDFLVGQARNESSPFEFVDMSVKEPWSESWKTNCRSKIKGCDGFIFFITKNLKTADGALWEIQCALQENVPVCGIYVGSATLLDLPYNLWNLKTIQWTWKEIGAFINSL